MISIFIDLPGDCVWFLERVEKLFAFWDSGRSWPAPHWVWCCVWGFLKKLSEGLLIFYVLFLNSIFIWDLSRKGLFFLLFVVIEGVLQVVLSLVSTLIQKMMCALECFWMLKNWHEDFCLMARWIKVLSYVVRLQPILHDFICKPWTSECPTAWSMIDIRGSQLSPNKFTVSIFFHCMLKASCKCIDAF